jgi:hypothetical protein
LKNQKTNEQKTKDIDMKNNSNRKASQSVETPAPISVREQIEARAYQIWVASGGGHGSDLQHWLQAEAEILQTGQNNTP